MTKPAAEAPEYRIEARVVPIRARLRDGDRMTFFESLCWALGRYVRQPLETFRWRSKITPQLRERCVDYALRNSGRQHYDVCQEAQHIAEYIARGERP